MFRSLRARLVLFSILPLVVAAAIIAPLAVRTFDDFARERDDDRARELQVQAKALAVVYARRTRTLYEREARLGKIAPELRQVTSADVYYIDDGVLDDPAAIGLPTLDLKVDWSRIDRGETILLRNQRLPGHDERYIIAVSGLFLTRDFQPEPNNPALGAFALVRRTDDITRETRRLREDVQPAFLIAAATALALALYLGWSLTRPIRRLVLATERIGSGDYRVKLDRRRRDEIGVLNRAFGDMADKLAEAEEHERLFLMRVSHELRTPLTAIRGHVDALADGIFEEEAEREEAYAVIAAEASRLGRLIGDLLDLSKLEARQFQLQREEVDLASLLEQAWHARRGQAREQGFPRAHDAVLRQHELQGIEQRIVLAGPGRCRCRNSAPSGKPIPSRVHVPAPGGAATPSHWVRPARAASNWCSDCSSCTRSSSAASCARCRWPCRCSR